MFRNIMFYTGFILTIFPGYIGLVIPSGLLRLAGKKDAAESYLKKYSRFYFNLLIKMTGSRITVTGGENFPGSSKGICVVANHQSYTDILVIEAVVPFLVGFVAKKELSRVPVLRRWMKELGCILIDRRSPKSAIEAISRGVDSIKKGKSLVIFPEGTRSRSQRMNGFKPGSLKLAIRARAVIVPITLNRTYRIYEEHSSVRSAEVSVVVHPPVDTSDPQNSDSKVLAEKLRKIIESGLEKE